MTLRLSGIRHSYDGEREVLRGIDLEAGPGEILCLLGPSGDGKTTLLETIAGVTPARGGAILLGDAAGRARDVTRQSPETRGVGLVYQHAYLFPHLTVAENVAYGAPDEGAAREAAARLGADALYRRPVSALSGGERQVVALARALARRPSVLLLDEPFGALDPRRRTVVRREVRRLHREQGLTVLQVTHDFTEAGLLGDVAVLLDAGRVLQAGPPEQVFRRPASPYIAEFLGAENVYAGEARVLGPAAPDWEDGDPEVIALGHRAIEFRTGPLTFYTVGDAAPGPGYAVVRAEEVVLARPSGAAGGAAATSARNHFHGTVAEVATSGALTRVTVDVSGVPLVVALTTRSARELGLAPGLGVEASFKAMAVHLC